MKQSQLGFLLAAFLAMLLIPARGQGAVDAEKTRPAGAGVYYIDADGDGYGVASPRGPDADDDDASVNTPETVGRKYADIAELLKKRGYNAKRIFYVAPGGSRSRGHENDPEKPFADWEAVAGRVRPGDVVLFREGVYKDRYPLSCIKLSGSENSPIVIAAFPGQRAVLDATEKSIAVDRCRHLVFDGFVLTNSAGTLGKGIGMKFSSNITLRNIESTRHYWGWIGMQDLHDILAERCVFHDNPHEHGIYLGAHDKPNTNLTVRKCLMYRNGYHGFQHNGRVRGLVLEDNVIHSNSLGGISLIMGVSDSVVRNNLVFNNNKQGIIFYTYDDRQATARPYDQSGNLVTGNTIWVGRHSWDGKYKTGNYAAILFNDATAAQKVRMERNAFRGNTIVTQAGEAFRFAQERLATTTIVEENLIHRASGPGKVMSCSGKDYDFNSFESFSPHFRGNRFAAPQFADVSVDYYETPEAFDFSRKSDNSERRSPARAVP
jgi:parallel beta-helix repeat protein